MEIEIDVDDTETLERPIVGDATAPRTTPSRPSVVVAGESSVTAGPDADACLVGTRYMDVDHPRLNALREELIDGTTSRREAAVRIFEFVRDEVRYTFGPWGIPASETLARRRGTCSNKNVLLASLLRGAGIPAACGVLRVDAFRYFGVIAPAYLKLLLGPTSANSTHIYAGAYLDGRWIKCDASTDRELAERTGHFCPQTRLVEWDGIQEAMDQLDPEHVIEDLGLLASIDDLLDKPARVATPAALALPNDYLEFIRSRPPFENADRLIDAYREHLGMRRSDAEGASRAGP